MKNREIKFRVWNGSNMELNVMVGFLGAFYVQGIDEKDSASMSPFNTKYFSETPVMQFTGMNDKNENEIYEGDIVRFLSWRDALQRMEEKKMVVEFARGFFIPLVSFGDNCKDYEVIGNIYENPELIPI
ncbi:MAG TPA: YopX family protein [Saprospiraceae bacterium]|nr:YopX family protein [Saprospiraceae bacterium]